MKDYFGYSGKVCVVTGASSGMGKATAEMLVDLGAEVYTLNRSVPAIDGLAANVACDLSDKASIDAAFAQLPERIDSFFGVAGASGLNSDFLTTTKIDFIANKYISQAYLAERMGEGGAICFVTSTGGNGWEREDNKAVYLPAVEAEGWEGTVAALEATGFAALPGTLAYPFSKLAMNYLTVKLQATFAPKGMRVNAVLPGSTETGLLDDFEKMAGGMDGLLAHCGYAGRLARPEEMAAPCVFLNSDMASYVSGERFVVDFAQTAEEVAGIREVAQPISLSGIQQQLAQMAAQRQQ